MARARTTVMCEREGYLQGFASVRVRTFLDIHGQAASDSASRRGRALPGMAFVGWPCLQGCRHREAAGRLQAVSQESSAGIAPDGQDESTEPAGPEVAERGEVFPARHARCSW